MKTDKRFYENWEVEIIRFDVSECEYEKRIGAAIRALLEIDEILEKREIAIAEAVQEAA